MKKLAIIILSSIFIEVFAPPSPPLPTKEQSIEFRSLTQPFSPELLKETIHYYTLYPEIVYAQARLETGDFISNIFKENNNCFGMKLPKHRPTLAIGLNRHSAVYINWLDSVKDLRMWQDYYMDRGYDLNKLLSIYCPEKNYKRKVKNLMLNIN